MKRDLDLIRNMLLTIESVDADNPHKIYIGTFIDLCGNPYIISQHIQLLMDSGFIEADGPFYDDDIEDFYIFSRVRLFRFCTKPRRLGRYKKQTSKKIGGSTALDVVKGIATNLLTTSLTGRFLSG